ncbi:MAG: glycosyltransferase family 4 protein [Deltaproteobacteria bacterium]|nr:glycosyltransferase family 4 protein [Deltaproteobacteria bacterium]
MTPPSPSRPWAILHTESSLGWGGQELRILAEAAAMRSRGHHLMVACDSRSQLYPRVKQAGFEALPLIFGGWRNLGAFLALRRILKARRVDVLNTHSSLDSWVGLLAWRTLRKRPILVRTRHLSTPVRDNWPTRRLYHTPQAIITTGNHIRELLARRLEVPRERIFSIPTGISLEEFTPREPDQELRRQLDIPAAAWIIGCVAVLRSWKGHVYLLETLKELRQEGLPVYLVLVGEGPWRRVIEEKIAELALAPWTRLVGHQEEVAPWLALMDAVVLASYGNEGVPQALLQALAMEKPVVGAAVGGIPEVVIPEKTGLLVSPHDPRALAQALGRFLADPAYGRQLGKEGRQMVKEKFSLEGMARAVEEVYWSVSSEQ